MARATLVLTRPEELQAPLRRPVSRTGLIWLSRFVARKPLGAIGAGIVLLLLFVALFAPLLSPYEYDKGIGDDRLLGPSLSHPFGTDANGRDMLSRIVWGARVSITVGFGAVSLSAVLAVTIGVLSAYLGGWFDLLVQRFVDVWISFPALVLLISLIAVIGPGLWSVTFVLGILLAPGTSRVIRGAVIGVRHLPYMEAARCLGAGHGRIIAHHVLPNVLAPVIVIWTLEVARVILMESALSFLGLGVPPPTPTWGRMLAEGRDYLTVAGWIAIFPGLAILVTVLGINFLGDGLRDLLDPRLRQQT
jgi:peptide/nickel transport system permease protein